MLELDAFNLKWIIPGCWSRRNNLVTDFKNIKSFSMRSFFYINQNNYIFINQFSSKAILMIASNLQPRSCFMYLWRIVTVWSSIVWWSTVIQNKVPKHLVAVTSSYRIFYHRATLKSNVNLRWFCVRSGKSFN
jgi:hypothetical protein